jgi:hypothetical protein
MLRPFYKISIQQIPTPKWTDRNLNFNLDFLTECEINYGWERHTDKMTLKFPKNISQLEVNNSNGEKAIFAKSGTYNVILGSSGTNLSPNDIPVAPLIMKGDVVVINYGYIYRNINEKEFVCSTGGITIGNIPINSKISKKDNLFQGYVSNVGSEIPITIEIEDAFYLLKRTPFDLNVWNDKTSGGDTRLYSMMQHILDLVNKNYNGNPKYRNNTNISQTIDLNNLNNPYSGKPYYPYLTLLDIPNSVTAQFRLGYLDIGDMTCAQLLDKLRQQYHFQSSFRGNVLQFGFPIYDDVLGNKSTANSTATFVFRDIYNNKKIQDASANIFPSHDLNYSNKDDVILSATVECATISEIKAKTLLGVAKTKKSKLKILVYWDIVTSSFKYWDLSKPGTQVPLNPDGGERHQFFYPVDKNHPAPTLDLMFELGKNQLYKYHYEGFRGCFTTLGFPFVEWNDNINLLDPIVADRNGQYKVKMVKYKMGMQGLSQEIHLDYRINSPFLSNKREPVYMM